MMDEWKGNSKVFHHYVHWKPKEDNPKAGKSIEDSSFETAAQHNCFGGILNDGYVDVSFDSKELSDSFWKMAEENDWNCLILENPTNGNIHSIWKLPEEWKQSDGKDKILAVGLIADIHSKGTRTILRLVDVDRFPPSYEPEEIQTLPEELYPVNTDISLFGMKEGDGRNGNLFKYILNLQPFFTVETIRRILTNTNDFVFKTPLPKDELQTILRDAAFQKPSFFKGKVFQHNLFGDYMIRTYHIKSIDGVSMVYQDGIYNTNQKTLEKTMLKEIPTLKTSQRNEVLGYINVMTDEVHLSPSNMIAFRNGILNVETGELLNFSPDYILINKIPWDYNPYADDPEAEAFLNRISCNDPGIVATIEESIGYCFYRENFLQKAFFLTGSGSNGKSTFLKVLNRILGKDNVSPIDLKNLSERFSKVHLVGKLANIGDDIGDDNVSDAAFFKTITGENRTAEVERKGKDGFTAEINCKLFFSCNQMPKMGKRDKLAISRRLILIPFQAHFEDNQTDFDPHITEKLSTQTAIEYFIKVGINGLKRLLQNQKFTESKKSKEAKEEYEKENDSVKAFVDENGIDCLFMGTVNDVYVRYCVWCRNNDLEEEKKLVFGKSLKHDYNIESYGKKKNGETIRFYRKGG